VGLPHRSSAKVGERGKIGRSSKFGIIKLLIILDEHLLFSMDFQDRPRSQPHDVSALNIKCAECGCDVKTLPFEPTLKEDGTYGRIYCQDCNKKRRSNFRGGGFRGGFRGGRF
jgi:hypothetical protein